MYWAYAYAIDVTREPDLDRVQWHPADPDVARVLSLQDGAARQILDKSCAPVSTAQAAPAASPHTSTPVVPPPLRRPENRLLLPPSPLSHSPLRRHLYNPFH
jgi:hypothetical protein